MSEALDLEVIDVELPVYEPQLSAEDGMGEEVENLEKSLEAAMENFSQLEGITEDIISSGGISKRHVYALESINPDIIPEHCPVESYTLAPTHTNLSVTMERINITRDHVKGGIIALAVAALAKFLHWVWKKITGVAQKAEDVQQAVAKSLDSSKASERAVKELERGGRQPIGPVQDPDKWREPSNDVVSTAINAPNLSQALMTGLSARQLAHVITERRRNHYLNAFKEFYTRLMDDILGDPRGWIKFLDDLKSEMEKRVSHHQFAFEIYQKYVDRFLQIMERIHKENQEELRKIQDPHERMRREQELDAIRMQHFEQLRADVGGEAGKKMLPGYTELRNAANLPHRPGMFGYTGPKVNESLIKDLYKRTGLAHVESKQTLGYNIQSAADSVSYSDRTRVISITDVPIDKVEDLIKVVDGTKFSVDKITNAIEDFTNLIDKYDREKTQLMSTAELRLFQTYLKALTDDVKATNGMARIYIRFTDEIAKILSYAVKANSGFTRDTASAVNFALKQSPWLSEDRSRYKKLKASAEEIQEGLSTLRSAVDDWKAKSSHHAEELRRQAARNDDKNWWLNL